MDKHKTCQDCPERELGCHSKCEGYLTRRAALDAAGSERLSDADSLDYTITAIRKVKRRKNNV